MSEGDSACVGVLLFLMANFLFILFALCFPGCFPEIVYDIISYEIAFAKVIWSIAKVAWGVASILIEKIFA